MKRKIIIIIIVILLLIAMPYIYHIFKLSNFAKKQEQLIDKNLISTLEKAEDKYGVLELLKKNKYIYELTESTDENRYYTSIIENTEKLLGNLIISFNVEKNNEITIDSISEKNGNYRGGPFAIESYFIFMKPKLIKNEDSKLKYVVKASYAGAPDYSGDINVDIFIVLNNNTYMTISLEEYYKNINSYKMKYKNFSNFINDLLQKNL